MIDPDIRVYKKLAKDWAEELYLEPEITVAHEFEDHWLFGFWCDNSQQSFEKKIPKFFRSDFSVHPTVPTDDFSIYMGVNRETGELEWDFSDPYGDDLDRELVENWYFQKFKLIPVLEDDNE